MTPVPGAVIAFQAEAVPPREGLPYWILWFLLCIILLLSAFIFLRDKDLRQRINFFFIGAKHKSIMIRLRMKLKKEKQKREGLWKALGEKAWEQDLDFAEGKSIRRVLSHLENRRHQNQMEWEEVFQEIQKMSPAPAAGSEEGRAREKDLQELERRRERIQGKIKNIERHRDHRLRSLGKLLDSLRIEAPWLEELYSQINSANQRIFHLEQRIENLSF